MNRIMTDSDNESIEFHYKYHGDFYGDFYALGEALTYTINQQEKILVCLENGRLEIDNNLAENKVRPAKLGAKNYLFFGNAGAGINNTLFYTLMANCKTQGLNPEDYLIEVIKRLPHNATPEQAAELTEADPKVRPRKS